MISFLIMDGQKMNTNRAHYLTPIQASGLYGLKTPTLRLWCRQGRIKHAKLGKLVLINDDDLKDKIARVENGQDFDSIFNPSSGHCLPTGNGGDEHAL
jgi:excisionase family DNA binding protein